MSNRDSDAGVFVSAEQIAEAPEHVRHWLLGLPASAGESDMVLDRDGCLTSGDGLAICASFEIEGLLAALSEDYLACQVLFALGCDYLDPVTGQHRPRVLHFDDFFSRTDVNHSRELERCLEAIDAALRQVRRDPKASLYRLEGHGGIHLHPVTQRVIYQAWCKIAAPSSPRSMLPHPAQSDAA